MFETLFLYDGKIESYAPSYFSRPKSKSMKTISPEPMTCSLFIVDRSSVKYLFCVCVGREGGGGGGGGGGRGLPSGEYCLT